MQKYPDGTVGTRKVHGISFHQHDSFPVDFGQNSIKNQLVFNLIKSKILKIVFDSILKRIQNAQSSGNKGECREFFKIWFSGPKFAISGVKSKNQAEFREFSYFLISTSK